MPLNFPENPTPNQYYVYNGIRWRWNGYAWASAGISGGNTVIGGICGEYVTALTGGVGVTLTSPSGVVEISLKLDEPNIGPINTQILHTAPTTFSADTGFARKAAFLQPDGSVAFDFIKNYDVFRNAEFNFDILSYNIPGLNPQLAGNPATLFLFDPFLASINYTQFAVNAEIDILSSAGGQITLANKVSFPATVNGFQYTEHVFTTEAIRYKDLSYNNIGSNQDYYILRLGVTGENSDGTLVYKTKDYNLYFGNYLFYGAMQATSINQNDFDLYLTANLILNRNFLLNSFSIPQDNNNPYYLYFAYPARLGLATFRDNSTNLEGGFIAQSNLVSYTNSRSYTENYIIYRSENSNLGTVSITVS